MLKVKVVGTATSTVKHPSLAGVRMLVVQAYGPDGATPDGHPLVAIDTGCGARRGDEIIITSDGRYSREALNNDNTPVRWTVIGISDE